MAQVHERVFAWVAVVVVIVSVGALSAAVIIQQIMTNNQQTANTATQPTLSCTDSSTTEPTYAAPAKYLTSNSTQNLQITDITAGNGQAAKNGDCLIMKYYGTLATDGTVFDENYTKPTAFAFTLGQGQVITGWDQGLVGMKVGGERRLIIPAAMAYGDSSSGSIPANSVLVFDVRLLRIQ